MSRGVLRVGVVGCGLIGAKRAQALGSQDELVGCHDVSAQARDAFAANHGTRAYGTLAELLGLRPDVVIVDLMMPRLDGVELTRRIRQDLPPTKVILMSSYTEDAYRLMASDSGADAFVSKQVLSTSLLPAIRDVIRRRFSGGSGPLLPFAVVLPAQ